MLTKNFILNAKSLPISGEINEKSLYVSRRLAKEYRRGIKLESRQKILGYYLKIPKSFKKFKSTFHSDHMVLEVKIDRNSSIIVPSYYTSKDLLKNLFELKTQKSLKRVFDFENKNYSYSNVQTIINENKLNEADFIEKILGTKLFKNKDIKLGVGDKVKSFTDDLLKKLYGVPESHYVIDIESEGKILGFIPKDNKAFKLVNYIKKTFADDNAIVKQNLNAIESKDVSEIKRKTADILNKAFDGKNPKNKQEFINIVCSIYDNPGDINGWIKRVVTATSKSQGLLSQEDELFKTLTGDFAKVLKFMGDIPENVDQAKAQSMPEDKYSGVGAMFNSGILRKLKYNFITGLAKQIYSKFSGKKYNNECVDISDYDKQVNDLLEEILSGADLSQNDGKITASQDQSAARKTLKVVISTGVGIMIANALFTIIAGYSPLHGFEERYITELDKNYSITQTIEDFQGKVDTTQAQEETESLRQTSGKISDLSDSVKETGESVQDQMDNLESKLAVFKIIAQGVENQGLNQESIDAGVKRCGELPGCSDRTLAFLRLIAKFNTADEKIRKQLKKEGLKSFDEKSPEVQSFYKLAQRITNDERKQGMLISALNSDSSLIRRGAVVGTSKGQDVLKTMKSLVKKSGIKASKTDVDGMKDLLSQIKELHSEIDTEVDTLNEVIKSLKAEIKRLKEPKMIEGRYQKYVDYVYSPESVPVKLLRGYEVFPIWITLEVVRLATDGESPDAEFYPMLKKMCEDPQLFNRISASFGLLYILTILGYARNSSGELGLHVKNVYDGMCQQYNIFTVKYLSISIATIQMMCWAAGAASFKNLLQDKSFIENIKQKLARKLNLEQIDDTVEESGFVKDMIDLKRNLNGVSVKKATQKFEIKNTGPMNLVPDQTVDVDVLMPTYNPQS